jgi:hypothetical protein
MIGRSSLSDTEESAVDSGSSPRAEGRWVYMHASAHAPEAEVYARIHCRKMSVILQRRISSRFNVYTDERWLSMK